MIVAKNEEDAVAILTTQVEPTITESVAFDNIPLTPENYAKTGMVLQTLKAKAKEIEDMRVALVKPLNDHVNRINDLFRPVSAKVKAAQDAVKRFVERYQVEERKKVAAETARLQAIADEKAAKERAELKAKADAAAAAGHKATAAVYAKKAETVVAQAPVVVQTAAPAGIVTAKVWTFEIVDPTRVPRDYMMVDEQRIRTAVLALKENCKIPGVRVYQKEQTRV